MSDATPAPTPAANTAPTAAPVPAQFVNPAQSAPPAPAPEAKPAATPPEGEAKAPDNQQVPTPKDDTPAIPPPDVEIKGKAGDPPVDAKGNPTGEPAPFVYDKTGDVGLDLALDYIGQRGLSPEHPAVAAAQKGDFSLIRATLAAMGDKAVGYEAVVALAEKAYKETEAASKAHLEKISAVIHDTAGSKEQWESIRAWASQNADADERESINRMLNGSPMEAKAAVQYLKDLYTKAGGTVVAPKDPAPADRRGADSGAGYALSPEKYREELHKLQAKLRGRDLDSSPEYQQLRARRLAFRG